MQHFPRFFLEFGSLIFYNFASAMAKYFKILLMIFALGIFVVPKQIFFAENKETSCCNKEKPTKSCCDKSESSKPCKNSENKHHSCDGNCSNCSFCSTSVVFLGVEFQNEITPISPKTISNKVENFYLQPSLSQLPKKIWQPPKIS